MPPEDQDGLPKWDQEEADGLVGLLLLVGVTYLAADGETVTSKLQYYGRIVQADETGIKIACEGSRAGQTMTLPPDLRGMQAAKPGQYRLRSTGEVVENPDLTAAWSITDRPKS
jgi:hypothetical protein